MNDHYITGVIDSNQVCGEVLEDLFNHGINLSFESAWSEFQAENNFTDESEDIDDWREKFDREYCVDGEDYLLGSWKKDNSGKYEPNKTGEFSAIYNGNYNTIQIVFSRHYLECRACSPCYPGQGDLGSPISGGFDAYSFPADYYNESEADIINNVKPIENN